MASRQRAATGITQNGSLDRSPVARREPKRLEGRTRMDWAMDAIWTSFGGFLAPEQRECGAGSVSWLSDLTPSPAFQLHQPWPSVGRTLRLQWRDRVGFTPTS